MAISLHFVYKRCDGERWNSSSAGIHGNVFIREISCLQQEQGCILMEELAEKATIDEPIGGLEVLQKEDVLKILEMAK